MKITLFDIDAIGNDLDLSPFKMLGECEIYANTPNDKVCELIHDTEVAIINKIKITKEVINAAPKLKLICVAATGYDNIDTEYCKQKGVAVCNVPGYSTESVALVTASIALSLITHLKTYSSFCCDGGYTRSGVANKLTPPFNDLSGKTWGIIGYGNIGRRVGEIAKAFGCKVIYNKRTDDGGEGFRYINELLSTSDIISIHCPLSDKSYNLINKDKLDMLKKSAIIVNTARGAVCDEEAVANAIIAGDIAGFGCDVYSIEPFSKEHPFNKIKDLDNVLLTPHIAWASFEARSKLILEMAENVKAFYDGKIRNRVEL